MEFNLLNILIVFISTLLADMIWAYYFISISQKQAITAGIMSILIALISAYVTISYVHNPLFLIPVSIGAFAGTYYAVKRHENKGEKSAELEERIKNLEDKIKDIDI